MINWEQHIVTAIIVLVPAVVLWLQGYAAKAKAEAAKLAAETAVIAAEAARLAAETARMKAEHNAEIVQKVSDKLDINTDMTEKTHDDIKVIERATNSMKDALIVSTDKASRAEGRAEGLAEGRAETK